MRNHELETSVLEFIEKNEDTFVDEERLVKAFKTTDPLHLYDTTRALRMNKKIERVPIGNYFYYKTIK